MSEPEEPELRLSDAERQDAMEALGEHFKNGRLDVAEYDQRAAQAAAARKRSELTPLFADLPEPKPAVLNRPPGRQPPAGRGAGPANVSGSSLSQRLASSAVPVAAVVAVVLFFTVLKVWMVFLIPALVALLVGALLANRRS